MGGAVIVVGAAAALAAAYWGYGRWLERRWGVDPARVTPAHRLRDGVDYVPAGRGIVFGHQFASIAGAAPIVGPILAAGLFGWVPVLAWILLGGILIGAVHDFAALFASIRNDGKTIGFLIQRYVGKTGRRLFLGFVWLFSILVIAAFADIVSQTFGGFDADGLPRPDAGAVASTSTLFIVAAVALGFFLQRFRPGGWTSAGVAMVLLAACIAGGLAFPMFLSGMFWLYAVFAYIFVASVAPVWALLQPRDYLNSFLLVAMILAAFIGVLTANPAIHLPAFTGFVAPTPKGEWLFPILFVTVACGAVSGFHSLIASGTASKQLDNERDIRPVSYGAMMIESLLAVVALVAAGAVADAATGQPADGTPIHVFSRSIAGFLTNLGLPAGPSGTLITLAVSAFALTSLDSVARVGRLAFQEFFAYGRGRASWPVRVFRNRYVATAVTLVPGFWLARDGGYMAIWPLFGAANQLLAALALLACALFLKRTGREARVLFAPMFVMLAVTFTALVYSMAHLIGRLRAAAPGADGTPYHPTADIIELVLAAGLLMLGVVVAVAGVRRWMAASRRDATEEDTAPASVES